jgi:hypothetical protein
VDDRTLVGTIVGPEVIVYVQDEAPFDDV